MSGPLDIDLVDKLLPALHNCFDPAQKVFIISLSHFLLLTCFLYKLLMRVKPGHAPLHTIKFLHLDYFLAS
jgi:hypothetical protein